MKQTEMLAMILAGGRGSRLKALTSKIAKPAVSFGGRYRIIDFPLSNCANSGLDVVGVLTQYESVLLSQYVSQGRYWGLDSRDSGVFAIAPREKADATIAVIGVPMKEASRFGIMNADENDKIYEFQEKPAHPKSNLASMGIYIFSWKVMRRFLLADMKSETSSHDFGKDLIPALMDAGRNVYAYRFKGYWKDVGTIDSLWEANMDLLDHANELNLSDPSWRIYSEDPTDLPQYIGPDAEIDTAYITQGCRVDGKIVNSVLFTNANVASGAVVKDTVLMPGAEVAEGARVTRALVADGVKIGKGARVGSPNSAEILLVDQDVKGVE